MLALIGATLVASCDTPDPGAFHHKTALDRPAGTGCHFANCTNGADVQTTTDTEGVHRMQGGPMIPGS